MKLRSIGVSLGLPGVGNLSGTWEVDEVEEKAAWELYVELVTRVPVMYLPPGEGSIREALTSIYSLFVTTRDILRKYGPDTAMRRSESEHEYSFAYVAIAVLNTTLRPLLTKWHPLLSDYESARPTHASVVEHERAWERASEFRDAMRDVERTLVAYADNLAEGANVHSLIIKPVPEDSN